MYENHTEQQIAEQIARRRARTEELKKKRKRLVVIQLTCAMLLIALLIVVGIFVVHAIAGRRGSSGNSSGGQDAMQNSNFQVVQPSLPDSTGSGQNGGTPLPTPDTDEPSDSGNSTADPQDPQDGQDSAPQDPAGDDPSTASPYAGRYADTIIYVDPGRGFSDQGCTSDFLNGTYESEINLAVAKRTAELLAAYGFTVALTHDSNEIPEGQDAEYRLDQLSRVAAANTAGCDLYLSIHCDNFPDNPSASGTRLYYCTDNDGAGSFADELAAAVEDALGTTVRISGKETDSAFVVTSQINAPSVLAELGFVTNEQDAEKLLSDEWREQMAQALCAGVIAYFTNYLQE